MKEPVFIILRGLPGAGKSTFGNLLTQVIPDCLQFETDQYLMKDGEYAFDQSKLAGCRKQCEIDVTKALLRGNSVILSNSSVTEGAIQVYLDIFKRSREFNKYFKLPEHTLYSIIVENRHGNISVHDVPLESMKAMQKKFEVKLC